MERQLHSVGKNSFRESTKNQNSRSHSNPTPGLVADCLEENPLNDTVEVSIQKFSIDGLDYEIKLVPRMGPFPEGYYSFEYGEDHEVVNILGPTFCYEDSLATLANFVGYDSRFVADECRVADWESRRR